MAKVNRIEALLDALASLNGMHDPSTDAYQLRNPLLLKSFALPGKHEVDDDGRRVFSSLLAGMKSGMFDLELKLTGKSRAGLKPTDAIENLCRVYGLSNPQAIKSVVSYLRRALKDETISKSTQLSYFIYGEN